MKARLTSDYACYVDGFLMEYTEGQEITGQAAKWAVEDGCAEEVKPKRGRPAKKAVSDLENK